LLLLNKLVAVVALASAAWLLLAVELLCGGADKTAGAASHDKLAVAKWLTEQGGQ
jgi:hypothetical protein